MHRWWCFLGVACLLIVLVLGLLWVPNSKPLLRVGTTGDYPPFTLLLPSGRYIGSDVAAAQQFANDASYQLILVPTTWQTWVSDLTQKRFDVAMGGINVTPKRQQQVLFSQPYAVGGKTTVTHCKYHLPIDLNTPTSHIITNIGGTNEAFVRQHYPNAMKQWVSDNTQLFTTLLAAPNAIIITDAHEAYYYASTHPKLCVGETLLSHHVMAYAVANDNPELLSLLNNWLAK